MALLEMVIGAIVEMGVQGPIESSLEKAKRRESVVKILKTLKMDGEPSADDFEAIYAYTLVEYGVFKPEPLLNFFRNKFIRDAFHKSFYQNDLSILNQEAEGIIEWNNETQKLGYIEFDPRREFAAFTAIFNEIVDRTRTPSEVKRDLQLTDVHRRIEEILRQLDKLDSIDDIRAELMNLQQSYRRREFIFSPNGDKLKVFVSSKILELRDLREMLDKYLEERGLDAWIYENDGGARPGNVVETSLHEVEAADVYVGLFWRNYGEVTIQEFRHARGLGKPCFVYIRERDIEREKDLEDFLRTYVYDPKHGVTYDYFDKAQPLLQQVADDILAWLVREHREMTAEIKAARISQDETARLQATASRFQAASRQALPFGTPSDYLAQQLRGWFQTLGYQFESRETRSDEYFEWYLNIPARRGYDRIIVRGMAGEASLSHLIALRRAVNENKVKEGWLITTRRISQATIDEAEKPENQDLFCYTFDELLDQHADFTGYLEWLENEVKSRYIHEIYVPLAATKGEFDPVTKKKIGQSSYGKSNGWLDGYIDRWLDDPSKEHISILGEFGTGKTWFVLHYAWTTLQRYKEAKKRGVERPRLPLVIPLRDYAKAVSVESLFSEFFFRKHEIPLPGYSAFEQLNRMGKLLLIFDGFDEMAARIDRQKMINNFWELAQVVVPGSKAILTCRTEHFPTDNESRELLSAKLQASISRLTGEPPQFEVLHLEKFDNEQIRQVLSFRASNDTVRKIMGHPQLLDLVRRPIMTELVMDALPDIESGQPIDLARVYLYAVRRKMERDIKAERTFTSLADKLYFMCEISWEMLSTHQMSLNYRDFPERLRNLFPHAVKEQKNLDHWHYDMMGQTMLIRNSDGDYSPAHRSLLEFFCAYKFAAELGSLQEQFVDVAKKQTSINDSAMPINYTWSNYFQRQRSQTGNVNSTAPLKDFTTEPLDQLLKTVGSQSWYYAILVLMKDLVDSKQLWNIIELTRGRTEEEVSYVGGNVISILALKGELAEQNLSNTVLIDAVLDNSDLRNTSFEGACLMGTRMVGAIATKANFTDADLRGAILSIADLSGAELIGANLMEARLRSTILDGANLQNATVGGAEFKNVRMKGVNFENVSLSNAILSGRSLVYAPAVVQFELLGQDKVLERVNAIKDIGKIRELDKQVIDFLKNMSNDSNVLVKMETIKCLGKISKYASPEEFSAIHRLLVDASEDIDSQIRIEAIKSLAIISKNASPEEKAIAINIILASTDDIDESVRAASPIAMMRAGGLRFLDSFQLLSTDKSPQVRRSVAVAMGFLRSPNGKVVTICQSLLKDEVLEVRISALNALARNIGAKAIDEVEAFLQLQHNQPAQNKITRLLERLKRQRGEKKRKRRIDSDYNL